MFDVGFWELCLVGVVALLVIGPERLPRVARETGLWLAKARRIVASVREEIKEELQAEEMRQMLREQSSLDEVRQTMSDVSKRVEGLSADLEESRHPAGSVDSGLRPDASENGGDEKH